MSQVETKTRVVLRFFVFNGQTKKLEMRDTDDLYSINTAKGCLQRCIDVMMIQGSGTKPSPENEDQTYRLFGLKNSFLYSFLGVFIQNETLLTGDPRMIGVTWPEFLESKKKSRKRK